MSKIVQWKRGNTAATSTYTGPAGEIVVNTDTWSMYVHDGVTAGGHLVEANVGTGDFTFNGNITATGNINSENINVNNSIIVASDISAGNITANYFIGNGSLLTGITAAADLGNIILDDQTLYGVNEPDSPLVLGRGYGVGNVLVAGNLRVDGLFATLPNIFTQKVTATGIRSSNVAVVMGDIAGYFFTPNTGPLQTNVGLIHREHAIFDPNISALVLSHQAPVAIFYSNSTNELIGNLVVTSSTREHNDFSNAFVEIFSNVDSYSQLLHQNLSEDPLASTDVVLTSNDGTDSTFFADFGIASNTYSYPGYGIIKPHDVYLLAVGDNIEGPGASDGANLILGSTTGVTKFFSGAPEEANLVASITPDGLIPGANVTYSLGSEQFQWKDLWVSNNTIYIDSIPLSITANGTLEVNGSPVSGSANIGNFAFDGNSLLNLNGGSFNNGDLSHGATASLNLPANGLTSSISLQNTYGNVTIGAGSNASITSSWLFNNDGSLTAPGKVTAGNINLENASISLKPGASQTQVEISPNPEGWAYLQVPNDATANVANVRIHNDAGNIEIAAGDTSHGNPVYYWYFDNSGNLSVPKDINFNGGSIRQVVNEDLYIRGSDDESDGWSIYNVVDDGAGNDLTHTRLEYNQFSVRTNIQGATSHTWQFDDSGTLRLPGNVSGNYGGNLFVSVGDQPGSDTFIDLRTISYVGDALISNIRIANPNVTVSTSGGAYNWTFGGDGILTVPDEGVIRSLNDTVILQSKNTGTGNVYSVRLGTTGGLYFETTEYPSGWLSLTNDAGNANVTAASGTSGAAGKNINITAGSADQNDYYTTAGGDVNLTGGRGAFNDGGGGGPGGNINISAGVSADPAGHSGNINIVTEGRGWTFDYTGNLTLPFTASPSPTTGGGITFGDGTYQSTAANLSNITAITYGNTSVYIPTEGGDITFQRLGTNYGHIGTGLAIGYIAGNVNQGISAVALGTGAGTENQGYHSVAVGWNVGQYNQGAGAIAIGENPGYAAQGNLAIAIGTVAGRASQGSYAIAMGVGAGYTSQTANAVAIGTRAGQDTQGENAVAVGIFAGNNSQGGGAVAVGPEAGKSNQGVQATAIGIAAGSRTQGNGSVALGSFAGQYDQKDFAIAIGSGAAATNQGYGAIAIGVESTTVNQGDYSIAIGFTASNGNIQPNNSIIIDATNSQLAATGAGLFVSPVRYDTGNVANVAYYNAATKEITYAPAPTGGNYGNSNVSTFLASFGSNVVSTTGNITGGYFIGNGALLTGITAGSNYGDSNVVTLLSSYGSNTIVTTGNITGGNITSGAGKNVVLGNATSQLRQIGSNALVGLSGSVTLTPDTGANSLNGVIIGGNGYILAPNGARNLTLNYNADSGHVGLQANTTIGVGGGGGTLNIVGTSVTGSNVIVGGVTNTVTFPNTVAKFSSNVDSYSQLVLQNKITGTKASTDVVATANNGTDTIFYVDLGIAGNTYDNTSPNNSLGTVLYANDSYLYAQGNTSANVGGNLVIGAATAGKNVKIFANGVNSTNTVATFSNTGVDMTGAVTTSGNATVNGLAVNNSVTIGTTLGVTGNITAGNLTTSGTGGNISGVNVLYANSIVLSSNAAITMSSRPAMRVYGSSSTTIGVNTTLTTNHFTVDYNQNSNLDGTSGVFTAPIAGLYQVTLNARVGTNNGTNQIGVFKNNNLSGGSNVACFWETDTNTGTATHFGTSGVINLAVGDNLRARVVLGNVQFDGNDSWTVTYIG